MNFVKAIEIVTDIAMEHPPYTPEEIALDPDCADTILELNKAIDLLLSIRRQVQGERRP